jgi:hypothetical protein
MVRDKQSGAMSLNMHLPAGCNAGCLKLRTAPLELANGITLKPERNEG